MWYEQYTFGRKPIFFIPKTIVTEKQIRLSGKNMGMGLLNEGNALRWRMQSFAWADAKLCVDGCNALRWRMQCFALELN